MHPPILKNLEMGHHMASKTEVTLIDDLDGTVASETVHFSYAGIAYEIDLSRANAKEFARLMDRYAVAARRLRGGRTTRTRVNRLGRETKAAVAPPVVEPPTPPVAAKPTRLVKVAVPVSPAAVRKWAAANGHAVSARGKIPPALVTLYQEAGN
jgi:hypothetical protein